MINPQELKQMQQSFASVDKDKSGEISATELTSVHFGNVKFGIETASILVKVFDKDKSGQIGFNEFASLYKFISTMQSAFQNYDRDRSGSIEFNEVIQAIQQGGFQLSPQTLNIVFNKFNRSPLNKTKKGLNMELFIQLCAFLGAARSSFVQYDTYRQGWITINMDQLVLMTL